MRGGQSSNEQNLIKLDMKKTKYHKNDIEFNLELSLKKERSDNLSIF